MLIDETSSHLKHPPMVINDAVEASTLKQPNDKTKRPPIDSEFPRVVEKVDILIVSLGGYDIANRPQAATKYVRSVQSVSMLLTCYRLFHCLSVSW